MDLLYAVLIDPFVQMAALPDFFVQVLWEGLVRGLGVSAVILPAPSAIAAKFAASTGLLWADFVQTVLKGALSGFVIGTAAAFATAILADRLDVTEEMTRLAGHLSRLDSLTRQNGEVGKRLDFLIQEAFREINTCGNKAQNLPISRLVVDFKAELEKCREQVQNIE